MTHDPARKLIEEAEIETQTLLFGTYQAQTRKDLTSIREKLSQALSLLPEWQEFDPKREETWPEEEMSYLVAYEDGSCGILYWEELGWDEVAAYQFIQPYVKP